MNPESNICDMCERGFILSEDQTECISCEIESCSSCEINQIANSTGDLVSYASCTQCDPTFSLTEYFLWIDDLTLVDTFDPVYVN